jgi:hypothetical protein
MATPEEPDFPPGHPARFDYDPESPEAIEWARKHIWLPGERDWPVGHPAAVDTQGNKNATPVLAGVDPDHPELEAFTGRTPKQVEGRNCLMAAIAELQRPTPPRDPVEAPPPPKNPGSTVPPSGQPGDPAAGPSLINRLMGRDK